MPVWWEANTRDDIHRALDLAEEFGTDAVIVGGREAGKVVEPAPVQGRPGRPPARLPRRAQGADPGRAIRRRPSRSGTTPIKVTAEKLAAWKERVAVAKTLAAANVRFAFIAEGTGNNAANFHAQLRKVIAAGLSREAALDALTRRAAEIAGLGKRLGTIEKGKLGHLAVMTGQVGDENSQGPLRPGRRDQVRHSRSPPPRPRPPRARARRGPGATSPRTRGPGNAATRQGAAKDEADARSSPRRPEGEPKKDEEPSPSADEPRPTRTTRPRKQDDVAATATGHQPTRRDRTEDDKGPAPFVDIAAEFDADRKPTIRTGGNVLIKDATILTVTRGTIPKGSILIRDGKIAEVGPTIVAPEGVTVIEAAGMVAMPGIIDTHSHQAVQGGVNEATLSIVPEVRVKDVVTGDDPGIYSGPRRRDHRRPPAPRLGQHDRRPGRRDQAQARPGRPRPDPQGQPARREVRPGRERHPPDRPVPQHPDGRRGRRSSGPSRKAGPTATP